MVAIADRLEKFEEKLEGIQKSLSDLDGAAVDRGRIHDDGAAGIASYWQQSHEPVQKGLTLPGVGKRRRFSLPKGYKPYSQFESFGRFLQEGCKAFAPDFGNPGQQFEFSQKYNECFKGIAKAIQGMSTDVGADGGFAVLPEFAPDIYDRVYENDIWSRTDNYTVTGNKFSIPKNAETSRVDGSRHGGIRAYWTGQGETITKSAPTLATTDLKLNKLAVVVYLTEELIQDNSYAIEQYVTRKVSEEFNFMLGDAVVNGDGVAKPTGFLNSGALVSVAKESGQAADTVVAENILKMWARRHGSGTTNNLVWLINQDVEPQLHQLSLGVSTAGGQLVYMPPTGLSGSPYATLMGRPVVTSEFMSTVGDQGDIALVDLAQYVTIQKGGLNEATSTHVEFLTDQLAIRFTMRVDGRTYDDSAITPYKGTNTQSAFVTLAARA